MQIVEAESQNSVQESDIESLARETRTPVRAVQEIYQLEHAKLERNAKIKTYVPVLARRRVKDLLRGKSRSTQASRADLGLV
jgi:Protein of unknown function (DUF3562)